MSARDLVAWLALALWLAGCAAPPVPAAPPVDPAQTIIFYNGPIVTMDPHQPTAEALLMRGEKIEAVGGAAEVLALQTDDTRLVDLGGLTLMPGFVDAHTHVLNDARSLGMSLDEAQMLALRNGITTLGDLYVDEPFYREIQAFNAQGALRVRASLYMVLTDPCGHVQGDWYQRYPADHTPGRQLRVEGVKLFTDGGTCGGVALSFELEPGAGEGDLWNTQAEVNQLVAEAQAAGYQVAIHAIGDRAVEQAQAALAAALAGGPNTYRHRVEHLSVLRPEQITRFGELGLVPVVPGQYPACTPFGPPVPEPYHAWEWPWRDLRSANPGLPIAWHSDYPYWSINPLVHLYGFVTRNDVQNYYTCPPGAWLRDDVLTTSDALAIMTINSAYALFRDTEVGSLEAGKYADLIVMSDNPLTVPADDLRRLSVLATMAGGRWEWCNPLNAAVCPGYVARTPAPLPDPRPPVAVRWLGLALAVIVPLGGALSLGRAAWRRGLVAVSAPAAVLGGAAWAAAWAGQAWVGDTNVAWLGLTAGTLLALAALGLAAAERPTRLGWAGVLLAGGGAVLLAAGTVASGWWQLDEGWLGLILGLLLHLLGLIVYGLANLLARRRTFAHWLPLLMGVAAGIVPFVGSSLDNNSRWPAYVLGLGVGGGWVLLGLWLARRWQAARVGDRIKAILSPINPEQAHD
ncbi:MAG: amidohydrolase family protein [Anaerolineales bacterium]|nr:amidohydrolase family protein [Anaerolineales bacterium]